MPSGSWGDRLWTVTSSKVCEPAENVSGGWICRQRVAKVYEPVRTSGVGVTHRLS